MYNIMEFIDDTALRLSREIKDLDDVRHAMAALEAIRKKQIEMDMALGPIEVSTSFYLDHKKYTVKIIWGLY